MCMLNMLSIKEFWESGGIYVNLFGTVLHPLIPLSSWRLGHNKKQGIYNFHSLAGEAGEVAGMKHCVN